MKFKLLYNILLILLIIYSCENKITTPERLMNQPVGIDVFGFNNSIKVQFYGNNIEDGFRGYNVYITETPGITTGISPVLNIYSSKPTLPYGMIGCYPDASQKSFITLYNNSNNESILNNRTYYVAISSYATLDKEYVSPLSEEVAIKVKRVSLTNLNNQTIAGKTGDGILFTGNGNIQVIDASDTLVNGWGGDLTFQLKKISGSVVPMLSVLSNNNSIQDIGYYPDITSTEYTPSNGYTINGAISAIVDHVYILNKGGIFIRLYISEISGSISATNSDVVLKLKCAY